MASPSDVLAWASVAAFLLAVLARRRGDRAGRLAGFGAWILFGAFWGSLIPHFALVAKSFIETIAAVVVVPLCVYTGYRLYGGRDSLFVLTRAVAVMGLLYLPFETFVVLERSLIEITTAQVQWTIDALGYSPQVTSEQTGYRSTFVFTDDGHRYVTYIVLACTGLGAMVTFTGLIAAVEAPLRSKLRALAVTIPTIWVLNIARNTFIAVAYGEQWFRGLAGPAGLLFGFEDPALASFYIADRVLAQSLSVVALVGILWLVLRELPPLLSIVEDVLYLLTGTEYDLADAFDADREPAAARADGGRQE